MSTTLPNRFWSKVQYSPGCWLWTASTGSTGYGQYATSGKTMGKAHRLSWAHFNGPIPKGLSILHSCDVTICVNPLHLSANTHAENMHDMARKGRARNGTTNKILQPSTNGI